MNNNKRPTLGTPRHIGSIPDHLNRQLSWGRILVRTGFNAAECNDYFDFSKETIDNRNYFIEILRLSDLGGRFEGNLFYPLTPEINEQTWLNTIEHNHGGLGGTCISGFNNIELLIMDTFMAGITRWVNYIGIDTGMSCDGHGEAIPIFSLNDDSDSDVFWRCLKLSSNTKMLFVNYKLRLSGAPDHTIQNIRPMLLDLAEALHAKRDELFDYVKADRELLNQFRQKFI